MSLQVWVHWPAALILGRRKYFGPDITLPHNVPLAVIGASLLWLGWYGFNAGGAYATGGLTFNVLLVTHMASAASSLTWIILSWKTAGKPSVIAGINGAIAGLAGVTAASGFITVNSAMLLGVVIGISSFLGIKLIKERLKIDDVLDVSYCSRYIRHSRNFGTRYTSSSSDKSSLDPMGCWQETSAR